MIRRWTVSAACKVQELFCYLLLHRDRPHPREALSALLWRDIPTTQSKKYLRQALWQLQAALNCEAEETTARTFVIESDWIQFNPTADVWIDVAEFEQAVAEAHPRSNRVPDGGALPALEQAAALYQGDLMEGWYQDWCLQERERLQNMHLAVLEKLMEYSEARHDYEAGLSYGARILRHDRAHERTHQRLMRLLHLSGDRGGALRQYERCVAALEAELGVKPTDETVGLCDDIRTDRLAGATAVTSKRNGNGGSAGTSPLPAVLRRLRHLRETLAGVERQVDEQIKVVEHALHSETTSADPLRSRGNAGA